MLKLAILGCGRIGKVHARSAASNPRCRVTRVADADGAAAEALARETGARAVAASEAIADPDVDAVVIGSPTDTHADYIESAARAGKAILCEKPVDLSAQRVALCLERIAPAKPTLMIGFNRRFDPNFAAVRQRIREGRIGEVESVSIVSRDPAPPSFDYIRRSGGLFRDMMIHDFDLARFLLGEEPVEVYASGAALFDVGARELADVDTAAAMLRTARGAICQITCSRRASYGYDQRIEVHGSKGMLRAGNIHATTVECADAEGFHGDPLLHFFLERYMPAYQRELDHFIACVLDGGTPSPNGHDGLMAQRLADAAAESAAWGRPTRLSPVEA